MVYRLDAMRRRPGFDAFVRHRRRAAGQIGSLRGRRCGVERGDENQMCDHNTSLKGTADHDAAIQNARRGKVVPQAFRSAAAVGVDAL